MKQKKIHTEECIAKIILEICFKEMYPNIIHSDSPDLESDIRNVEVTTICEHCDLSGNRIRFPRRYLKDESKKGILTTRPINDFDSVNSFIIEAAKHKLNKQYGTSKPVDLFIYCLDNYIIYDFSDDEYLEMTKNIKEISKTYQYQFQNIYIQTVSVDNKNIAVYNVIMLDLVNGKFKKIFYDMNNILDVFSKVYIDKHNGYAMENFQI